MISKVIVTCLLALSVVTGAHASTLLVFGDSLSAAYNLRQQNGWVSLLTQQINERELDVDVVNASVSGETTQGGLSRLPALLERHQPDWMVLELGANDGLRGYPLEQVKNNLAQMIDMAQAQDTKVLLLGNHLPPNYGRQYTEQFFNLYKDLAESKDLAYVPFMLENVALDKSLMLADGLHPNADGQPVVLENIAPTLLLMLEQ
ncbi:arylesterase [Marinomonas ostreistagni]|uniref:arylesterase n=1 Tax=Marinomonas ostreistagni TaxID=359209 RepID=UPI00195027DA|nr:arylesterase [Marinomonas ostreistagni]MBM6550017.1 arylesterase [Marinomonas ostreistagni]